MGKNMSKNLMDIELAIQQSESWISEYWPLETSVATNPLFGKVDQPFCEVLKQLEKLGVAGTMPLSFYWDKYLSSEIKSSDIKQALRKKILSTESDLLLERSAEFLVSENLNVYYLKNDEKGLEIKEFKKKELIIEKVTCYLGRYFTEGVNQNKKIDLLDFWIQEAKPKFLVSDNKNNNSDPDLDYFNLGLIETYLNHLDIKLVDYQDYFTHILFSLRGYASLIKWLKTHPENPWLAAFSDIEHLILMWAYYQFEYEFEYEFKKSQKIKEHQGLELFKAQDSLELSVRNIWEAWFKNKYPNDVLLNSIFTSWSDIYLLWQTAFELGYQENLIQEIQENLSQKKSTPEIQAQFVFCMDTRSEGARRYLEANSGGAYQTFSSAGFFGIPFSLKKNLDQSFQDFQGATSWQSPGLIIPKIEVQEVSLGSHKKIFLSKLITACRQNFKSGEQGFISAFSFIEWASFFSVIKLFLKEISPRGFLKLKNIFKLNKKINLISEDDFNNFINNLAVFVKTLGLTQKISDLVFIMGHEASADNNPFLSGLQCGACGGNSGFSNAKVVCELLNNFKIRNKLLEKNIVISEQTVFIPGCHQTTIDQFVLDFNFNQKNHQTQSSRELALKIKKIQEDLKQAGKALTQERLKDWPNNSSVLKKQSDWAELIPELGLANHTSLIIGPRFLTQGLDLSRRCFLYSYDPKEDDSEGRLLESILMGPLVVAHWINAYYYFSTCSPKYFGGGNKVIHNLLGKIGVLEGNGGDIKIGLPIQSIYFKSQLLHEPRRLGVIIYGDRKIIDRIINKHQVLKNLIQGQWVNLSVLDL